MPLLYDAVAFGMAVYTRTAFRVRTLGTNGFRLDPGTLIVTTHRRETDVPLICPSLYGFGRLWADRSHRMSFSAREDMFEPGFFAGFPAALPLRLRKALYRIEIGGILRESLHVHPLRSATVLRLNDVFRERPDLELEAALPSETLEAFRSRAAELRLPRPARGGDVLRGEYADLLWLAFTRQTLDGAALEPVWRRRVALATADFRFLVDHVRRGAAMIVFPEGRPSPDGEVGPLRPGLGALVRRGRPAWLQPVGIAYDPLVRGRTLALVSLAQRVEPPAEDIEETVLRLLRLAVPLTCGQIVARRLTRGAYTLPSLEDELSGAVEEALARGRSVDPDLLRPASRRRRLEDALSAASRRKADLAYLAREAASAGV